ncbi:hypothetical protein Vretifemale_5875, partial [Volvox reticuliferus]
MDFPYSNADDDEEDYFRSLDAILASRQEIKSILGGGTSGQAQVPQCGYAQPTRACAARQPFLLADDDDSDSNADDDNDDEYEPSSEQESEPLSEDMEAAEAAAQGVLDAEADIAKVAAGGAATYGSLRDTGDGDMEEPDGDGDDGDGDDDDGLDDGDDHDDGEDYNSSGSGSDADRDLDSYIVRSAGEVLPPGSLLERLYAALDTNWEIQRQLSLMLERLDSHSNTSYVLERRVRDQKVVSKPKTAEARALLLTRAATQAVAASGVLLAPVQPPQTSRFWRIGGVTPAPSQEWSRLAAAQQLPLRPYDKVRWPSLVVDKLNKGLTLEVQSILTKQVLDRVQEQQQQLLLQRGGRAPMGAAAATGPGASGGAGTSAAGPPPTTAPATANGGGDGGDGGGGERAAGEAVKTAPAPNDMQSLQEQLKQIATVRPDSVEAIPIILRLDDEAWARVAASHRVGRSGTECAAYYRHNLRPGVQWPLQESQRLMELAEKYGNRHWDKVAAELGTGRTAGQCLAHCLRWSRFDRRPQRDFWSEADDDMLKALVAKYGADWVAVAEGFGGRFDRHQVRDRWHGVMKANGPRRVGKWTPEEDAKLTQAVDQHGQRWTEVAPHVAGRTARQCRERYVNLLQPGLKFGPFSPEEQQVVVAACKELQAAYGRIIWVRVAERLPGRTDDQCRRAYEGLVKHDKAHIGHKRGAANHLLRGTPGARSRKQTKKRKRTSA